MKVSPLTLCPSPKKGKGEVFNILIGFLLSTIFLGISWGAINIPTAKHKNKSPTKVLFNERILTVGFFFFLETTFFLRGFCLLDSDFERLGIFFEEDKSKSG